MQIQLAYGRQGLTIDLPESVDIIQPEFVPGLLDEAEALQSALKNPIDSPPLSELVQPSDKVVIVHTDITRATPNDRILPVILAELENYGLPDQNISLLNGLGTHRPQTDPELRMLLGDRVVERYRCLQHNCYDDQNLVFLG